MMIKMMSMKHEESEGNDDEANDVIVDANDENAIGVMRPIFNCK